MVPLFGRCQVVRGSWNGVLMRVCVLVIVVAIVVVRVVEWRVLAADAELRRGDAGPHDPLGPDRRWRDRQAAQRPPDVLELHTGVDQRAEHHVASGTGEAVEVEHLHNLFSLP